MIDRWEEVMKRQKLLQGFELKDKSPPVSSPSSSLDSFAVPLLNFSAAEKIDSDQFFNLFDKYQLVHLSLVVVDDDREIHKNDTFERNFSGNDVADLFQKLNEMDKNSWTWDVPPDQSMDAHTFLRQGHLNPGYGSFLLQHDLAQHEKLLTRLPCTDLPLSVEKERKGSIDRTRIYGSCIWFFFGRNPITATANDIQGRPKHTDAVDHDGTFHYQLSGVKIWYLQPTEELKSVTAQLADSFQDPNKQLEVVCKQGDILVINTRLWWHSTILPVQNDTVPSVSYARDFYISATKSKQEQNSSPFHGMRNLDGLYATTFIESGTIIFTERDMPDCELHRSKENPNCELVELEDGCAAIVSCRDIQAGEFFCVEESDDEEEDYSQNSDDDCDDDNSHK